MPFIIASRIALLYTLEEAQQFFNLLANEPLFYQAFFTLAIYGGYRRGELCGLEWKDIDFDTCVISIRRTSLYTKAQDECGKEQGREGGGNPEF